MEMCFQYIEDFHETIMGFCNCIYTSEGGTHLTGFKTAYTMLMNSYARELNVLKDKDPKFMGSDVRNGKPLKLDNREEIVFITHEGEVLAAYEKDGEIYRCKRGLW